MFLRLTALVVLITYAHHYHATTATDAAVLPKGVNPDLSPFYSTLSSGTFHCLDGSATIPSDQVNDDFCDCDDGSDEPGTSACPNATFFCPNAGHAAKSVVSSRVNDGICDCCDGSDEWDSGLCEDNCDELGAEARRRAERLAKIAAEGFGKRREMSKQGKEMKSSKEREMKLLEEEIEGLRSQEAEREAAKKEAEDREKVVLDAFNAKKELEKERREAEQKARESEMSEGTFEDIDVDKDGVVTKEEMMGQPWLFDQNNDGTVSEEEATFFLSGNEQYSREEWTESGWLMIKHIVEEKTEGDVEGTAQAGVGTVEEVPVTDPPPPPSEAEDEEGFDEEDDGEENYDEEDEDYGDLGEDFDEVTAPKRPRRNSKAPRDDDEEYDDETRELVRLADEARASYEELRDKTRDIEKRIDGLREKVERDYGPDDAFAPLDGQCFEYPDNEYMYVSRKWFELLTRMPQRNDVKCFEFDFFLPFSYTVCPFDKSTQKPKHGGGETNLGRWENWNLGHREMKFGGGQGCWNGPQRSMTVTVICGLETKMLSVSEPSKCVYQAAMETPAACASPAGTEHPHDEL